MIKDNQSPFVIRYLGFIEDDERFLILTKYYKVFSTYVFYTGKKKFI